MTMDEQRKAAVLAALDLVRPGMRLGLGRGAEVKLFAHALAGRVRDGLVVDCVASSQAGFELCSRLGLRVDILDREIMRALASDPATVSDGGTSSAGLPGSGSAGHASLPLSAHGPQPLLDLMVDGADEVDAHLHFHHSRGGSILLGKVLALAARDVIVIADRSVHVGSLGAVPLAVETARHGVSATARKIHQAVQDCGLAGELRLRVHDGKPAFTDAGNVIIEIHLGAIPDPRRLEAALQSIPGVVATGLHIDVCTIAIMAGVDGTTVLRRPRDLPAGWAFSHR